MLYILNKFVVLGSEGKKRKEKKKRSAEKVERCLIYYCVIRTLRVYTLLSSFPIFSLHTHESKMNNLLPSPIRLAGSGMFQPYALHPCCNSGNNPDSLSHEKDFFITGHQSTTSSGQFKEATEEH